MAKILLVEDDTNTITFVSEWLTMEHHLLEISRDGIDALERLTLCEYDVILLDIDLPKLSGLEVCRQFRDRGGMTPIIMVTGHTAFSERETGLDTGADDYVSKPFNLKELSARIRAQIRRSSGQTSNLLKINGLELDPINYKLKKQGQEIHLLPKEFALLEFFMRNHGKIFSGDALMQRIWHSETEATTNALRSALKRLRQKIDDSGDSMIETVHGVGYRFRNLSE